MSVPALLAKKKKVIVMRKKFALKIAHGSSRYHRCRGEEKLHPQCTHKTQG